MTSETGGDAVLSSTEPISGVTSPRAYDKKEFSTQLASETATPRSITLDGFFLLPSELQQRIVSLTCRCPEYSHDESQLATHDYTMLNLLCASRQLHDLVVPVMYAHIRIHHSSRLFDLYKNLLLYPERGSMIRSLHLGPWEEMSSKFDWPLRYFEEDEQHGAVNRYHDRELAPQWYQPNFLICLDNPRHTCQGNAVHRAVVAAMSALDVDPYRREHGQHGQRIGLAAWCARVIELRAVMDLYIIQMRREEDEHGYTAEPWCQAWQRPSNYGVPTSQPVPTRCKSGSCGHYPPLVVEPLSSAPLPPHEVAERVFWLTRKQIARHLRRPHDNAKTDRFDHPLIFAREGYPLQDADVDKAGQRKIRDRLAGPRSDLDEDPFFVGQEDESDEEEMQEDTAEVGKPSGSARYGAGNASDYLRYTACSLTTSESFPGVETLSGLLALGCAVLALAPQLTNLSVGGIFPRLLVNSTPLPNKLLRCLCVGPVLPYWRTTFTSEGLKRLANVEKLRICVEKLSSRELDVICGQQDALPQLRVVQWEMVPLDEPATLQPASIESFAELARRLQGPAQLTTSSESCGTLGKRSRDHYEEDDRETGKDGIARLEESGSAIVEESPRRHPLYVAVLAHKNVLPSLLDRAPSDEARAAWQEGRGLNHSLGVGHRIQVVESRRAKVPPEPWGRVSFTTMDRMYVESEEWWRQCAIECGFEGW